MNTHHVPDEILPVLVHGCHLNISAQYIRPLHIAQFRIMIKRA